MMNKFIFTALIISSFTLSHATKEFVTFCAAVGYFSALYYAVGKQIRSDRIAHAKDVVRVKCGSLFKYDFPDGFNEAIEIQAELEGEMVRWREENPELVNVCKQFDVAYRKAHNNTE